MATIQLDLTPFDVPTRVTIRIPGQVTQRSALSGASSIPAALPTVSIADLAPNELDALAKTWLDNLFAGVGRASPFVLTGKSPA